MKKAFCLLALLIIVLFNPALSMAQQTDTPIPENITILPRPQTFEQAQQVAMQNRVDRMAALQQTISCIQSATNVDVMHNCLLNEFEVLVAVRLAYCDTDLFFLPREVRQQFAQTSSAAKSVGVNPSNAAGTNSQKNKPAARSTECERALATITGRSLKSMKAKQEDAGQ